MTNATHKITTNPDAVKPSPELERAARAMYEAFYDDGHGQCVSDPWNTASEGRKERWCRIAACGLTTWGDALNADHRRSATRENIRLTTVGVSNG